MRLERLVRIRHHGSVGERGVVRLALVALAWIVASCSSASDQEAADSRFGAVTSEFAWQRHLRGRHNPLAVSSVDVVAARPPLRQRSISFLSRTQFVPRGVSAPEAIPEEQRYCPSGTADCNEDESDGCETPLLWSVEHCGACGNACEAEPGGWNPVCSDGACGRQCPSGLYDRDGLVWNGCEYRCRPKVGLDIIDDRGVDSDCDGYDGVVTDSVYVRQGASGTLGSPADPLGSIDAAVALAQQTSRHHVLVSVGDYWEFVRVVSGVSIHGGFDARRAWTQTRRAGETRILGRWSHGRWLRIVSGENVIQRTVIERVRIDNSGVGTLDPGADVHGVWCRNCPGLSLRYVTISLDHAVAGAPGREGSPGAHGWRGHAGLPGSGDDDGEVGGVGGRGAGSHCGSVAVGGEGGAGGGSENAYASPGKPIGTAMGGRGGAMSSLGDPGGKGVEGGEENWEGRDSLGRGMPRASIPAWTVPPVRRALPAAAAVVAVAAAGRLACSSATMASETVVVAEEAAAAAAAVGGADNTAEVCSEWCFLVGRAALRSTVLRYKPALVVTVAMEVWEAQAEWAVKAVLEAPWTPMKWVPAGREARAGAEAKADREARGPAARPWLCCAMRTSYRCMGRGSQRACQGGAVWLLSRRSPAWEILPSDVVVSVVERSSVRRAAAGGVAVRRVGVLQTRNPSSMEIACRTSRLRVLGIICPLSRAGMATLTIRLPRSTTSVRFGCPRTTIPIERLRHRSLGSEPRVHCRPHRDSRPQKSRRLMGSHFSIAGTFSERLMLWSVRSDSRRRRGLGPVCFAHESGERERIAWAFSCNRAIARVRSGSICASGASRLQPQVSLEIGVGFRAERAHTAFAAYRHPRRAAITRQALTPRRRGRAASARASLSTASSRRGGGSRGGGRRRSSSSAGRGRRSGCG